MFSVIIPAHNEEALLTRCLDEMAARAHEGELDIIVVANGCTDRTAEIARSYGPPVRVIETEIASKIVALRLGDEAATHFPRFYVDADVILPIESIRAVGAALQEGRYLAAAPKLRVDLSKCSWAVRAYYDIWLTTPYHTNGMIGSGVYAMSEEGRKRFDEFPDIISDDGFARLLFSPEERGTVDGAWFMISPPETLSGIVKIKTRSKKGALQLALRFPEMLENDPRNYGTPMREVIESPRRWPKAAVYLYVQLRTKFLAYWMNYFGDLGSWERDDSSRVAVERPPGKTEKLDATK